MSARFSSNVVRGMAVFVAGLVVATVVTTWFRPFGVDAVTAGESTFVPMAPCRLFDTRPASQVGPKSSPLGPDESHAFQVTGANGDCSVPGEATAVAINLTGVAPSANTHLRAYPSDAALPTASMLNMTAGQAPTPNKFDVKLSADGRLSVYNRFGTIHVIGDVLGYYRSDGLADLQSRLAALEASQPFTVSTEVVASTPLTQTVETYASVSVSAPVAGTVTVDALTGAYMLADGGDVFCTVAAEADLPNALNALDEPILWYESDDLSDETSIAGTRTFPIAARTSVTYALGCETNGAAGTAGLYGRALTATFNPAP